MGYAGGRKKNPTYHDLGDHAETLEVDYDPSRITYEELLGLFWSSHSPIHPPWSRQYMSAIFYHDEKQKGLALETRDDQARRLSSEIHTEIVPPTQFYLAEDYHQKYLLRRAGELMAEFAAMYPDSGDFVASTAAARVNGYLGRGGTSEALEAEIESLGLSPEGQRKLLKRNAARR